MWENSYSTFTMDRKFKINFSNKGEGKSFYGIRFFFGEIEGLCTVKLDKAIVKTISNAQSLLLSGVPHIKQIQSVAIKFDVAEILFFHTINNQTICSIANREIVVNEFINWEKHFWLINRAGNLFPYSVLPTESVNLIVRVKDFYFEGTLFPNTQYKSERAFTHPIMLSEIAF